jgi:putative transposase
MRWLVGDFLLMPDHLHFFCTPAPGEFVQVERWTSYWKREFAKRLDLLGPWQRGLFHHRLRSEREYQDKVAYMLQNPVRAGLVGTPEDWTWQGRVHAIRW